MLPGIRPCRKTRPRAGAACEADRGAPVAPAAQPRAVASRQHSPTARTATTGRRPRTSPWAGGTHLILAEVGADLARTRVLEAPGSHQHVTRPGRDGLPPDDIPGGNTA